VSYNYGIQNKMYIILHQLVILSKISIIVLLQLIVKDVSYKFRYQLLHLSYKYQILNCVKMLCRGHEAGVRLTK
jgi:hypothetical protein